MHRFESSTPTPSQRAAADFPLFPDPHLAIQVHDLTFSFPHAPPALTHLSLKVTKGRRVLAGKRLIKAHIVILGKDVFHQSSIGVTFLGTEWASNPLVRSDILVSAFLDSVGGWRHKARRDRLLDLLDVDLDWHMHAISDGERLRVQLCMGLMAPWDVLLLDEVTVDVDVLVWHHLLGFLKEESELRGATSLSNAPPRPTHIFDGLTTFPTHIAHLHLGSLTTTEPIPWPIAPSHPGLPASLRRTEDRERWRRDEAAVMGREAHKRGARKEETTDSEVFYKKYDYSH
ncbi:hypothetical protein CALVIDRAFT_546712 [Calocera viscosa TUFC12733]|uniref:ABC transporter domain-containing protein n=1 Tax=Calocera viscosa (strain TUFC12733) TaxID=1330018 RepID=A0A167J2M0_CALVF|nr:hypothetical protein CALVIDRAFT_546712 [Calocera viscosa TUFC12733]